MSRKPAVHVSEIDELLKQVGAAGGALIVDVPDDEPKTPAEPEGSVSSSQPPVPAQVLPEITQPDRGSFTIEHRIRVTEAWQYPGYAHNAPDWVDRNWIGYADYDSARGIEPGPCLRVPFAEGAIGVTLCRIGDWLAKQEVLANDGTSRSTLAVWPKEQFERFFISTRDEGAPVAGHPARAGDATPPASRAEPTSALLAVTGLAEQDLKPLNQARAAIHEAQRNSPPVAPPPTGARG